MSGAPSEAIDERQRRIAELVRRLTADVPVDIEERTAEQQARWLLAYILDWHRREEKSVWWEYFRLSELPAEELLDERAGLAGLNFIGSVGGTAKAPIHRYGFPPQETELRGNESIRRVGGDNFGTVESISFESRTVDIKKRADTASVHPDAVFTHNIVPSEVLAKSLLRIGEYVAENGIEGTGRYQAARDLLLRQAPRIGGDAIRLPGETTLEAALRIAPKLEGGVFPVQGPPGAGKTYTGARMICALVEAGRRWVSRRIATR